MVATARLSAPAIQVPGDVSFAATCLGAAALATLNVCNAGEADLVVSGIASSNPRFPVQTPSAGYPVTVGDDACFPFNVAFTPTAEGPQSATLTDREQRPRDAGRRGEPRAGTGTQKDIRVTGSTAFGVVSAWSPGERPWPSATSASAR